MAKEQIFKITGAEIIDKVHDALKDSKAEAIEILDEAKLKIQEMGSRYLFIILYILLERSLCGSDYKKQ